MNYPAASCGVSKPQNPQPSKQLHLDVLSMEFLRGLFTALLLDILASDCCIALTPYRTDKGAFGPKCAAPSWLFDRRHSFTYFSRSHTFDGLHNLRWTVHAHRRNQAGHMIFISTDSQEDHGIPFGNLHTDLFEHGIDTGVKHDASLFCRTDQMVHQDGDIVALMEIFAHTSDNNFFKQAKQASGNLTPRD